MKVLGDHLRVSLENEGPGQLRVVFDSSDDEQDVSVTLGEGVSTHELSGPVHVWLVPTGAEPAVWHLLAWGASGLRVDMIAQPGRVGSVTR